MSKTSAIMIFVFGLVLLIIGVPLGLYKEEVTKYQYYSGGGILGNFKVPIGTEDVYPYQQMAVFLMVIGLTLIITGIYFAKKDVSKSFEEYTPDISDYKTETMWALPKTY